MTCDTNILFPALEASHRQHPAARRWLEAQVNNTDFGLCELVLMEIYTLLRNPAISTRPLSSHEAVKKILNLRENSAWSLLDYPGHLMDRVWSEAAKSRAYRRVYDIRLALTLRFHGVTDFATANLKDFKGFEFRRVWNPLSSTKGVTRHFISDE